MSRQRFRRHRGARSPATIKAVRHAHRRGVAHLDLKPENVLLRSVENAWEVPKVVDQYGSVDNITDVYQLGAVFYELFTGRPPFEGEPFEVMNRIQTADPMPLGDLTNLLPEPDEELLTALATENADRYEIVVYLRDAFEDLFEQ